MLYSFPSFIHINKQEYVQLSTAVQFNVYTWSKWRRKNTCKINKSEWTQSGKVRLSKNLQKSFSPLVIYHQFNLRFSVSCFTFFFSKKLDNFFVSPFKFYNFFTRKKSCFSFIMLTMNSLLDMRDSSWQSFNEN